MDQKTLFTVLKPAKQKLDISHYLLLAQLRCHVNMQGYVACLELW